MSNKHYPRGVPLQDIIWSLENGPIPTTMTVAFRNGNSSDCRIDNLYLVPVTLGHDELDDESDDDLDNDDSDNEVVMRKTND